MGGKILFCATVDTHFSSFHLPYLQWFKQKGWEVHVAAAGDEVLPYVDEKFNIPIERSPHSRGNLTAYRELKSLIDENEYKMIHCHTPMGGVLSRLAARKARKQGTKVIYTAHGFHFFTGAPFINWLLYYPIEKVLAHFTDCLITINEEDFKRAVKKRFKAKMIEHVHGVGVQTDLYTPVKKFHKNKLRQKYHYHNDAFLIFYAAEFNKNKNQKVLIEALALIKEKVPHARLLLAGEGPLFNECRHLSFELGVENMVDFLGYRNDIQSLLSMSDMAVASSLREGLPVNVMEAMACALPVVAVDNRGHRELIINYQNGWLVEDNATKISEKIIVLAEDGILRKQLGRNGRDIILSKYSLSKVMEETKNVYLNVLNEVEEEQWAIH